MDKVCTPPNERPEIEYLSGMYYDEFFPNFLVDKVKAELTAVVDFLMSGVHSYEEVQQKFDSCVESINAIACEFYEHGSEFETGARESVGETVITILERFNIMIDVETAIRERYW